MQLRVLAMALGALLLIPGMAAAQSLSPMRNEGTTPSNIKGFRLLVGNPYQSKMTFLVIPMDPKFTTLAADAEVNFPEVTMAPGMKRQVIVTFKIDPALKERTIGVCVQPKNLDSTILPRVCGTYIGRLRSAGG
jgi:hypothetical protein